MVRAASSRGLISPEALSLVFITDNVDAAVDHIQTFYRNYHSIRYVGALLAIRLRHRPDEAVVDELSESFADICVEGGIEASEPLPAEVADDDVLALPRVVLAFDRAHLARLRQLIDALNALSDSTP